MTGLGQNGGEGLIHQSPLIERVMLLHDNLLTTVVTYLEMRSKPRMPPQSYPSAKVALMRLKNPTISFYRYLYNKIGDAWLWYERRVMSDGDLASIILDEQVEVYVLYVGGVPAGLGELDRRSSKDIELAYFGLLPEFIGLGLAPYFLRCLIDQAWTYEPDRFWLHTCDLDHPKALPLYQEAGLKAYKREEKTFKNPQSCEMFQNWKDHRAV